MLNDRFIFTGPVPDEELAVYYRHAAVYISLSEHEGFCVPLVEAMAADVPVLAYSAAAVPDTLGGAGVQFAPKDLEYAAELLGALAFDDDLRDRVIAGQRRRLADFGDARITRELADSGAATLVKLAFIIQRYGAEVLGGSEHLCRLVAERLAPNARRRGAHDLRARLRHLEERIPGGRRSRPKGVTVRRFANGRGCATSTTFNKYSDWIYNNPHSHADEMTWLKQQGPWAPGSDRAPPAQHQQYDVLMFFTYLYAPTVSGTRSRASPQHPGLDGARRAGDSARDLQGSLQQAGRALLSHRKRAPVRPPALCRIVRSSRKWWASGSICRRASPTRACRRPAPKTSRPRAPTAAP